MLEHSNKKETDDINWIQKSKLKRKKGIDCINKENWIKNDFDNMNTLWLNWQMLGVNNGIWKPRMSRPMRQWSVYQQ